MNMDIGPYSIKKKERISFCSKYCRIKFNKCRQLSSKRRFFVLNLLKCRISIAEEYDAMLMPFKEIIRLIPEE